MESSSCTVIEQSLSNLEILLQLNDHVVRGALWMATVFSIIISYTLKSFISK